MAARRTRKPVSELTDAELHARAIRDRNASRLVDRKFDGTPKGPRFPSSARRRTSAASTMPTGIKGAPRRRSGSAVAPPGWNPRGYGVVYQPPGGYGTTSSGAAKPRKRR